MDGSSWGNPAGESSWRCTTATRTPHPPAIHTERAYTRQERPLAHWNRTRAPEWGLPLPWVQERVLRRSDGFLHLLEPSPHTLSRGLAELRRVSRRQRHPPRGSSVRSALPAAFANGRRASAEAQAVWWGLPARMRGGSVWRSAVGAGLATPPVIGSETECRRREHGRAAGPAHRGRRVIPKRSKPQRVGAGGDNLRYV